MGLNFAKVFHKAAELSEENQPANKTEVISQSHCVFYPIALCTRDNFPFDKRPQPFHDWTALDKSLSNNSGSLGCTYAIDNDYTVDSPIEAPTKLRKYGGSTLTTGGEVFSRKTETVPRKF